MGYTKELYESEYGYGYKIYVDGKLTIIQPHAPGVPGLKGMTHSEANEYADKVIERMSKPPEEVPESERLPEEMMHATRT
jgi:hypothetical protein